MPQPNPQHILACAVVMTLLSGLAATIIALISDHNPSAMEDYLFNMFASVFTFGSGAVIGLIGSFFGGNKN